MSNQHFKLFGRYGKITLLALALAGTALPIQAQEKSENSTVYNTVEKLPEFPGGVAAFMSYLQKNIRYPKAARDKNVHGRVNVTFVVEPNGDLSEVKAVGKPQPLLQDEAVRVMNASPKWKPGMQKGKAVRVQYTVPIVFSLS